MRISNRLAQLIRQRKPALGLSDTRILCATGTGLVREGRQALEEFHRPDQENDSALPKGAS